LRPLNEILSFHFDSEALDFRFQKEIEHAYKTLIEEMEPVLIKPLANDVNVLRETLCKYIEFNNRLGFIKLNLESWKKLALDQQVKYHELNRGDKVGLTFKDIQLKAQADCMPLIELAYLPEVLHQTLKDSKAMIKTILNLEMAGGHGG